LFGQTFVVIVNHKYLLAVKETNKNFKILFKAFNALCLWLGILKMSEGIFVNDSL